MIQKNKNKIGRPKLDKDVVLSERYLVRVNKPTSIALQRVSKILKVTPEEVVRIAVNDFMNNLFS